jgi:hypothetical protein
MPAASMERFFRSRMEQLLADSMLSQVFIHP